MSEFNILLINYEILKIYYTHEGIFGKGVDPLLDQPCTLHMMKSKQFDENSEGKNFVMQVFSSLQTDIFYRKLDQLAKSFFKFSSPFQLPIRHMCYKKNEETKLYDLYVMYEFFDIDSEGKSLQEIIMTQQDTIFDEQQLWELIQILIDQMYMGGRLSYEYLDINPWNIYYRNSVPIIANFGLQQHPKFQKKLFCHSDRFFQKNTQIIGNQQERLIEMYMRSYMFAIGMLVLYIGTKEDPNSLYTDNTNQIRPDLLQKRIEVFKKKYTSQNLHNFLIRCLQLKEEKRLDIEEVIQEKGSQLLNREIYYYQGKLEGNEFYSGFVKGEEKIKNGVGEFLMENKEIYNGMFEDGKKSGRGIYFNNKDNFAVGQWQQDELSEGMLILKNNYMYFGPLAKNQVQKDDQSTYNQYLPNGIGIMIPLATSKDLFVYEGDFDENGQPQNGNTLKKDGVIEGTPQLQSSQINQEESQLQQHQVKEQQN